METLQAWADERRLGATGNNFGGIRLLLAVGVLWSHCFPIVGGLDARDPLEDLTRGAWRVGTLAVNAFLLISGFCVAHSLARSGTLREFLARRVRRIYPAFVVLSLLTAFVVVPFFASASPFSYSARQLALIAVEIVDLVGYGWPYGGLLVPFTDNPIPGEINSSLWTVRYEFVCYLLLAVMSATGMLRTPKWCLAFAVAGSALSMLVALGVTIPWSKMLTAVLGNWPPWPRFAGYFFAGVAFYLYRRQIPYSGRWATAAGVGALIGLAIPAIGHAVGPLFGSYLVFWCAFQSYVNLRCLTAYGDFSYGFYLWAFPLQQAVVALGGGQRLSAAELFVLSTPPTLLLAVASWFLVERQFLQRERARGADAPALDADPGAIQGQAEAKTGASRA